MLSRALTALNHKLRRILEETRFHFSFAFLDRLSQSTLILHLLSTKASWLWHVFEQHKSPNFFSLPSVASKTIPQTLHSTSTALFHPRHPPVQATCDLVRLFSGFPHRLHGLFSRSCLCSRLSVMPSPSLLVSPLQKHLSRSALQPKHSYPSRRV